MEVFLAAVHKEVEEGERGVLSILVLSLCQGTHRLVGTRGRRGGGVGGRGTRGRRGEEWEEVGTRGRRGEEWEEGGREGGKGEINIQTVNSTFTYM